jgi:predicted oxidoreductase
MKKEMKMEMPEMDVSQAMHHLEKAEEIKSNKKLMAQIQKHHSKMGKVIGHKKIKSIDDLKKARDEAMKDDTEGDE